MAVLEQHEDDVKAILDRRHDNGADFWATPAPKGPMYPYHTANAVRVLCRLGYGCDRRLRKTLEHLSEVQHGDGGWRCNTVKVVRSPETDASDPGGSTLPQPLAGRHYCGSEHDPDRPLQRHRVFQPLLLRGQ